VRRFWTLAVAAVLLLGAGAARAADPVDDYDARLEEIAREVEAIRKDLEAVAREVAWAGMAQAFVFVERPDPAWKDRPVEVRVDGARVAVRRLLPEEWELLEKGLAVEVARVWVAAGEHEVWIGAAGGEPDGAARLEAPAARPSAWVAAAGEGEVEWRVE